MRLGKKQSVAHEVWVKLLERIEEFVTRSEVDALMDRTVEEIKEQCKGRKVAYGWSGGKDSVVLQKVMEEAGVEQCVMGMSDLEYPDFLRWVAAHHPKGLEVIINRKLNLRWLSENQHMLFPQDAATGAKWFSLIQHRAQDQYVAKHSLDLIILGRRRMDGNYTGGGLYTNGKGVTRYCPLAEWSHEHLLGAIHYYRLPLAPFYEWPRGFTVGTHAWAARQWTGSVANGWREVHSIDPDIVDEAAQWIPSARTFLEAH